jgi:non-specific serine/threonine protein kinase
MEYGLQMFEQAIQLDPNFALAHAGIAHLCGLIYELREQSPKWIERGLAACDRATALAPDLPEVLVAHARISYAQKKYDEAALLAQRAIERKPDCEGSWDILGRAYFASGRFEEAAALTERAIEANGDDYNSYIPYSRALRRLDMKKEAEHLQERFMKALRLQLEIVPEDVRARILLAVNLAYSGQGQDKDEAVRHLQTAVALRPGDPSTLYNAACTYGALGKKAEALETLKKCFAAGYSNQDWAARDTDLDLLHDDPEFQKLVGHSARPAS